MLSSVQVIAAGVENTETMQLEIDGVIAQTWDNIGGDAYAGQFETFTYNTPETLDVSQIRINFTNDVFDPDNGIDSNLRVDAILVDGVRYEAEADSVFSTGTWTAADGVSPGFGRGDTLHSNGYFQFATTTSVNGGSFGLEASQFNVAESDGSVSIRVLRNGGSDGTVTLDYATVDLSATSGSDFVANSGTLTFLDGETEKTVTIALVNDLLGEDDEQFGFTIDNLQGDATLLAPRTATVTIDDNDVVQSAGNGLRAEYFDSVNLTIPVFNRVDPEVNFNWANGTPDARVGTDTFSIRWTGKIEPRYSETYTFNTLSDDGVRLYIDGQLLIDQWIDQSATNFTGAIDLEAGVQYDIRLEYFERIGRAEMRLQWSSDSQAFETVPTSQLYAADPPPSSNAEPTNEIVVSNLRQPTSIAFSDDGRDMYVALKGGEVRVVRDGNLLSTPFIDISDIVNGTRDRGLLDIELHPDFENNPYVYLLFTHDPPEVFQNAGNTLARPDGNGNRAGRLIRVTADASNNYQTAVAGSEVVILGSNSTWDNFNGFVNSTNNFDEPPAGILPDGTNIRDFVASDSESHTVGALAFGNDGNLFVSIGDGTSYNRVDPRTVRVQDIDNLSGKILRINPITGEGLADNPFYNGDSGANRSKVYQLGVRNPFRMTVDPATGELYVGDVGWTRWEEVNSAGPGANFGWPYYEGGNGVSNQTNGYRDPVEAQTFYNSGQSVSPAVFALSHAADGINAIVLGSVYRGNNYPTEYRGAVFVNDLGQGIVRAVQLDSDGQTISSNVFTTGANIVVKMVQSPDGNMYYVDLDDGEIGRWVFE